MPQANTTQHYGSFLRRPWTLLVPASLKKPSADPCHYHEYPQQFLPEVTQSILAPARLVSSTPPTQSRGNISEVYHKERANAIDDQDMILVNA